MQLEERLRGLESRERDANLVRMWLRGLEEDLADLKHLTPELRLRIEAIEERYKQTVRRREPVPGETLVLLADPLRHLGSTATLSIERTLQRGFTGELLSAPTVAAVRQAYEGLCVALAEVQRAPEDAFTKGHLVTIHGPGAAVIDGPSLGLSACAAMLSLYLQTALPPEVVATAAVGSDGRLSGVGELPAKVRALKNEAPWVTKLVVAEDQSALPPTEEGQRVVRYEGLSIVRCRSLLDALREFGLDPGSRALPVPMFDDLRGQLNGYEHFNVADNDPNIWVAEADKATLLASLFLGARPPDPVRAVRALSFAAFFSLQAGDAELAARYVETIRQQHGTAFQRVALKTRLWVQLVEQCVCISRGEMARARALGDELLSQLGELDAESSTLLVGRAHGTYGRTLMHEGALRHAFPHLVSGFRYHRDHEPSEASRSLIYVANCLRRLGRLAWALEACAGVQHLIDDHPNARTSAASRPFLAMERGRCYLALAGRDSARRAEHLAAARQHIDEALQIQRTAPDAAWPKIYALRAIAETLRAQGDAEWERFSERCFTVALDGLQTKQMRQVAAYAAGDLLVAGAEACALSARAREVWEAVWGSEKVEGGVARSAY